MKLNQLLSSGCFMAAFLSIPALGDTVYVTARPQGCTVTANCPGPNTDGTYSEQITVGTLGDYGAVGTAPGHPQTTVARTYIGSTKITDPAWGVTLTPTLGVPGGVYRIDYNFNSLAGNSSTNVIMNVTVTSGGTLSFTSTDKLQRKYGNPANQWNTMGFVTNSPGSGTPTIEFRYASGEVSGGTQNRLLFDCWRFTLLDPCLAVNPVSVVGPLGTNSNEVVVAGVTNATKVTVYQNTGAGMVMIGSKTTGVSDGDNVVTVSGLVKGASVAATQTVGGQEGCVPPTGTMVGMGANPSVRVALSIRETSGTGPIGDPNPDASSSLNVHFLGTSALVGGGPLNAPVVYPSNGWQTVTFLRGTNVTIGDVANVVGTTVAGTGYDGNNSVAIQVYAYKDLPSSGARVFSSNLAQGLDVNSAQPFQAKWTWDAVPGANGYRVLRSWNYSDYNDYRDVTTNELVDANSGWIAGPVNVDPKSAPYGASVKWNAANGSDPVGSSNNIPGDWGILEGLAFSANGESGPYDVYIDSVQNGETVFQTFDAAASGTPEVGFRAPNFSGSTSGLLLAEPNLSVVSDAVAAEGPNSLHVAWQWNGTNSSKWLRLTTSGVGNPMVDLNQPISFKLLLLPVGAAVPASGPGQMTVSRVGNDVVLNWNGSFYLQESSDAATGYTDIAGPISGPYTNAIGTGPKFYRLRK